jgi:hypothetical protein
LQQEEEMRALLAGLQELTLAIVEASGPRQ